MSKYKQSSSLHIGDGMYLDLFLGSSVEGIGGGADNSNIVNIEQGYKEGKNLQKVFSLPEGHSVIMAVRVSCMGKTYTDILRYSASGKTMQQNFYCDNIVYFTENKPSEGFSGPVCVQSKLYEQSPTTKYTFKVLYASCGVDNITWYNNEFVNATAYARENERLTLKVEDISEDSSTTQILSTNAEGKLPGLDMVNHQDFIINTEASDGLVVFSNVDFRNDCIYRLKTDRDGVLKFADSDKYYNVQKDIYGAQIVSFVFTESETGKYFVEIDQQPLEIYYTLAETDEKIAEMIADNDVNCVHKTGVEDINGKKFFRDPVDFSNGITFTNGRGFNSASSGLFVNSYIEFFDEYDAGDIAKNNNKIPSGGKVFDAIQAESSNCVHKEGYEVIRGEKTFTDYPYLGLGFKFNNGSVNTQNGGLELNGFLSLYDITKSGEVKDNESKLVCGNAVAKKLKDYVDLTSEQTILGVKTFRKDTWFNSAIQVKGSIQLMDFYGNLSVEAYSSGKDVFTVVGNVQTTKSADIEQEGSMGMNLTRSGDVYDFVNNKLSAEREQSKPQVINFTSYSGETIRAEEGKTKFIIKQSFGSTSIIDITFIPEYDGLALEFVSLSGNTFSIQYNGGSKVMNGCSTCKSMAIFNGSTNEWEFFRAEPLNKI